MSQDIFFSAKIDHSFSMASNGFLFISNASKVQSIFLKASKYVSNVLYIKITNPASALSIVSQQIVNVYSKASVHCTNLDVRFILGPSQSYNAIKTKYLVDTILYDADLSKEAEKLRNTVKLVSQSCGFCCIDNIDVLHEPSNHEPVKQYEYVALGGTFDRLHNGHKILLSQAVLRSTKHVTVGVTDVNMIQTKKLWELIEPVEERIKAVKDFLTDINPELDYNVVPIQDLYGPTKDDPKYQLIVVSEETSRGANKINEKRKENGLTPLETYVIGLAADSQLTSEEEESKISSSNQRMRLLGTLLRPPVPNPNFPDWPYVIGLAGGIASGKSNIAAKLKAKGAVILNCDLIAHELYEPGLPLNRTLAETFGHDVITETGHVDRRKLGQIVFSDKRELEKLNSLVWPAVIEETQRRVKALGEQGAKVVVIEAAVMVRAKWYTRCHQLWAVIIPPEEAIKRLQKRNGLSEEEARQRIEAQPTNKEQVEIANVVFSPYWSYEYTQMQIDKAWDTLQKYLSSRQT